MTSPLYSNSSDDPPDDVTEPWFVPALPEDSAPGDPPWPVAPRGPDLSPEEWRGAEAVAFRSLIEAVEPLARFRERVRAAPQGIDERFALLSVSALLRGEGHWIGPEQIALFREMRIGGEADIRPLTRAAWAVRRLLRADPDPLADLRGFLGRRDVQAPARLSDDRPVGDEIDSLAHGLRGQIATLADCHELTRAAYAFARWRAEGLTPFDEPLEPSVAALCLGGGGVAPGLPMAPGHQLDAHATETGAGVVVARLELFYAAVRAGALAGLMELDRLARWRGSAQAAIKGRSGRTPPLVIETLLRWPVVSAELLAVRAGCTPMSARRNLALFAEQGLVREITGQDRYRFWTVAA